MATEKELQDEMERLRAEVQGLATDLEEAKTGLRAFGKATATGAYDLTKGMGSLALNVGRGDTSFKSLNSVVDIASNALSGMAKAIPFAGEALAAGIQATAAASKFMLEQMDNTAKAFNDLGRVGALTEAGMSGLQKQFTTSGLSLDVFKKQVGDNAQALARFKGMAGDGANAFSEITGSLTQLNKTGELADNSLRRLGLSSEDMGAATAAFVTQQTRLGLAQGRSSAELAAGTKAYAIELDALQKVTGMSREAIQKQQDAALSESRFRANYDELIAQGKEKEAKALMKLQTQISDIGPEAGQGVRDLLSGAGTDAARKLMASTGGAAQDILDRVKEGKLDETEAAKELQQAMKKTADAARNNAKYVDKGSSAFLDYAQQSDFINAEIVDGQLVKARQEKQMAEGTDKLTDQTISAQKSMEGMNIEMQKLGFTFLPQASKAVAAMTESMRKFVEYVNKTIGGGADAGGGTASGASTQQSRAAQAQTAQAAPAGQTNQVSQTMVTNTGGGAAMVYRGRRGGAKGGGAGGGGPEVDNSKEAVATAGGLIKGSLSGVNKGLVDALVQAVTAYGKPITVTSGLRSNEEQQKLYDDFVAGRSKFPAAKPGESKHNTGNAVDISLSDANALAEGGFLKAAGLGRPVKGDPVHIQQVSAANGAILSGPMGGYKPNLTMHGTEAIVPLNTPAQQTAATGGMDTSLMSAQLDRLDEMVSLMKNQLGVSTKIMQYNS
jgi:LAS superfamily LD-carboxypeptidase LdcB